MRGAPIRSPRHADKCRQVPPVPEMPVLSAFTPATLFRTVPTTAADGRRQFGIGMGNGQMRAWGKLTANAVRGIRKRGRYADGGGLYLQISKTGARSWVFLFTRAGVHRAMGLGSARSTSLATARELATKAREALTRNVDPIDQRERDRQEE